MADWIFATEADKAEASKSASSVSYIVVATHKDGKAPREWKGTKFHQSLTFRTEDEKVSAQYAQEEAEKWSKWGYENVAIVKVPANVEASDAFIEAALKPAKKIRVKKVSLVVASMQLPQGKKVKLVRGKLVIK
jgi:hypothetical protein